MPTTFSQLHVSCHEPKLMQSNPSNVTMTNHRLTQGYVHAYNNTVTCRFVHVILWRADASAAPVGKLELECAPPPGTVPVP